MSRVLILNKSVAGDAGNRIRRRSAISGSRFSFGKVSASSGSARINLVSLTFTLIVGMVVGSGFYLYQVNDIATKNYEIRDIENTIHDLNKESKKMEIQEVGLQSMDNIEKASQSLNLVSSTDISYVQVNGPMAMR